MTVRERYQKDPVFRRLVEYMTVLVEDARVTPTEIREAAMLAQIIYEERHVRTHLVLDTQTRQELDNLDAIRRRT